MDGSLPFLNFIRFYYFSMIQICKFRYFCLFFTPLPFEMNDIVSSCTMNNDVLWIIDYKICNWYRKSNLQYRNRCASRKIFSLNEVYFCKEDILKFEKIKWGNLLYIFRSVSKLRDVEIENVRWFLCKIKRKYGSLGNIKLEDLLDLLTKIAKARCGDIEDVYPWNILEKIVGNFTEYTYKISNKYLHESNIFIYPLKY